MNPYHQMAIRGISGGTKHVEEQEYEIYLVNQLNAKLLTTTKSLDQAVEFAKVVLKSEENEFKSISILKRQTTTHCVRVMNPK